MKKIWDTGTPVGYILGTFDLVVSNVALASVGVLEIFRKCDFLNAPHSALIILSATLSIGVPCDSSLLGILKFQIY